MNLGADTVDGGQGGEQAVGVVELGQAFLCNLKVGEHEIDGLLVAHTGIGLGGFGVRILVYAGNGEAQDVGTIGIDVGHGLVHDGEHVVVEGAAGIGHTGISADSVRHALVAQIHGADDIVGALDELVVGEPGQISEVAVVAEVSVEGVVVTIPVVTGVGAQRIHIAQELGEGNHELREGHIGLVNLFAVHQITFGHLGGDTIHGSFHGAGRFGDLSRRSVAGHGHGLPDAACQCQGRHGKDSENLRNIFHNCTHIRI